MSPEWSLLNPLPWTGAESPGDRAQEGLEDLAAKLRGEAFLSSERCLFVWFYFLN